jgi:hypothetical protein
MMAKMKHAEIKHTTMRIAQSTATSMEFQISVGMDTK